MMRKHPIYQIFFTALLSLVSGLVTAQTFPNRAITLVVPFAAGGGADIVGRLIAQKISENVGQQMIVENRAGAAGNIGASYVAKSKPDGYTLLLTGPNHTTNVSLFRSLSYDPIKDFSPITLLTGAPYLLVVNPSLNVKNLTELIAFARAANKPIAYGSAGNGTAGHLAMELLKSLTDTDMLHVPYKGSSPMLTDLIGGRVLVGFDNVLSALPYIEANQLRPIASSAAHRTSKLPSIPTVAESGLPGFEVMVWQGVLSPADTPADVIAWLNQQFIRALKTPSVAERLATMNIELFGDQPNEFAQFLKKDIAKWAEVVKKSGAQVD
ncbi:MAG: tripartite tricarboxylate transporter substrate binding protein [Alcaligenaceae bacterium]